MIKKLLFLAILLSTLTNSYAQKRIGIYNIQGFRSKAKSFLSLDPSTYSFSTSIPSYCVDFYSNNPDFITIDRKNTLLIEAEKELQKSENFMDGYVVGQGKNEGLDYIVSCVLDLDTYSLSIRILDVAEKNIKCIAEKQLEKNFWGIKDMKQQVIGMLLEINSKCFENDIPVVRITGSKGKKAKEILIAGGSDLRLKKGYELELYKIVIEKVGNKSIDRKVVIGKGVIVSVEDENFSTVEINDGGEEIMAELAKGTAVNCKLPTNK